jgi:phosphomannomutase
MIPQAIIFDLDGTLTESKSLLTPQMGIVLAQLLMKMPVAIMSGGSYAQFQKQLLSAMPSEANYKNLYLFPTSASQCYTWRHDTWALFYNNPFTPEEKTKILNALAEALHETKLDILPPQLWGEQIEDRGSQITWSALGQQAPSEAKKVWDPERTKRLPLQALLITRLPGFSIRANATNSIDITREGMTKAYGVQQFSKIIAIPIAQMLYVGDALFPGGNDEIVKGTGIETRPIESPVDTAHVIEEILVNASAAPHE